ncbi:predicted protein [Naegleria gruberi]|uniref:Predicted protein n=1 Tax=Naegleria gruberi TaxID=5762 RepID=D2UXA5_NAEGR|nr:uncharacterized protein NAEGRDRAFT_45319 [Naegleria gruberi]EFC50597.1 predicted protein [Naegleria gruberi]|eukprot:XP_002683341.1 predicted protein [Naegleria gruberi strain NEG-M]
MSQTPGGVGVSNNSNPSTTLLGSSSQQQPTDINSSLNILQEKIIYIDDDQPTSSDSSDTQQRKKQIQQAITNISEFFIYYYQQECKFNLLDSSSGSSSTATATNNTNNSTSNNTSNNNLEIFYKNVTNFLNISIQQLLRGCGDLLSLVAKKYSYTNTHNSNVSNSNNSVSMIKPVIAYYSIEVLELLLDKLKYSSEISTDLSVHSMIIKTMGLYITQLKHLNEAKVLYITEHLLEYEQFMIDLITNVFDEQYIKQLSTIQSEYQKHMHKYVYDKLYNNIYQSAKSSISNAIIDSTYSRDAISIMRYQLLKTLYYILLNGSPSCIEKYTISMIQYLNFNARYEKKYSILCIQELFVSLFGKKDKYYNLNIPSYENMKPVFINDEYDVISNNDVKKSNGLFDKIFVEGKKYSIYARRAMNSDLNSNRVRTRSLLVPYGESTSPSKNTTGTTGGGSNTPSTKKAFSYDSQFLNTGKTYRQILGMFNPVVIGLTKYFKHTHDRSLQNVVLFMLIRMICIGIDFSQLDKDSTFIKFIFNQLEKFDEPDFVLYQIMDFLSVLLFIVKYQHFPENPFDSIVKLVQSTFNSSQFEKNGNSILKSISPVMIRGFLCEIRTEKVEKSYGNLMLNEFLKNVTLPECQSVLTLLLRNVHHSTLTCSNTNNTTGNASSSSNSNNTSSKDATSLPWIELSNSILKEWVVKHNLQVDVDWNLISNISNHFQTNNIATTYYNHTVNSNSGGLTSNSSASNGNQSMNLKSNLVFQNRCKKENVQYEFNNCEFIIELSKIFYFIDALYININDQAKIVTHLIDSFDEHLDQNSLEKQVQTPSSVQHKENMNEKLSVINSLLKSLIFMKLLNRIDKKQANVQENLKNLERFLQSISNALNLYLNHRDTSSIIVIKYLTCEMLTVTIELQERLYIKLLTHEHVRQSDHLNSIFHNQILHILKLFNINYLKHYDFTIYTLLFSLLLAHSKVEKQFGVSFLNYLYGFYHSNIYNFNILNNTQLLLGINESIASDENNLTYHEFVIQQKSVFLSMINIIVNYQDNIIELFKQCEINNLSNRIWKEIFNHFDEPLIEKFLEKFCRDICCENDLVGLFDELNDKFKSQLHLNDLRILFKFIKNNIKKEHLIWLHPKIVNQLEERLKIETTFMKRKVISDMIKYINSNIEKPNENSKLNQEFKNLDLILEKVKNEMFKNQNEIPPSKLVNNFFTYNNLVSNPLVISNFLIEYMDKNELKYVPSIVSNLNIQSINNILVHFKDNVEFITSLLIHLKSKEQILPFIEFTFNELNNIPYNFTSYLKLSNLLSKLLSKCRSSNDLIQLYDKNMVINFTINFIELFYLERIQKHNVDITDVDYILSLILQILYSFGNSIEYYSENLLLILNNPEIDLNLNTNNTSSNTTKTTTSTVEETKNTTLLLMEDDYVDSFATTTEEPTEQEPQQEDQSPNKETNNSILEMNEDERRVLKFIKLSCQLIIDATSVSSQSINYNKDINILKYLKLILFKTFQLYPNMQASNEDSDIYGSVGNTTSLYGFSIGNRIPFISYHHLKLIRSIGLELSKCFINLVYDPYLPNMETQYFPRIDIEQVQTLIFMIQEIGCNEEIFKQLFEMSFDLLKMEITQPFDEIHVLFIKLLTCMICRMNQPPSLSNNFSSNILSSFDNFGNSLLGIQHGGNNLNSILNSVEKYLLKSTGSTNSSGTSGSFTGGIGTSNNRNSFNGSFGNMSNLIDKNSNTTRQSISVEEIYSKALFNSFMLFIHDSIQKFSKNNLMITKELVKSLILIMENNIVLFAVNNGTYSVQWLHELFKNIYKECNLYEDWILGQYALYGLSKTYAILHSNNAKDVNEDFIIKTMESSLVNNHLKQSALQSVLSFIECGNRNIVLKLLPYLASNIQTWLLDKEQTVYNQLLLMKMVTQMVQQYPEASVHQLTKKTMESLFNLSDDIDAPLTIVVTIFKSLQKLLINYSLSQFERSLIEAMTSIKQSTMITRNDNTNAVTNRNDAGMMNKIVTPFKKMTIDTSTFSNFTQMLAQNKTMLINRKSTAGSMQSSSNTATVNTSSSTLPSNKTNNSSRISTEKPSITATSNNISITVGSGIPNSTTNTASSSVAPTSNNNTATTKMKQFMSFFTTKKQTTPPTSSTTTTTPAVNQPSLTPPTNPTSGSLTSSPSLSSLPMSRSMSMTSIVSSMARSSEKLQTLSQTRRVLLLGLMSTSMYTSSCSTQQQLDSQRERAKVNILHLIEQFHDGEIDREDGLLDPSAKPKYRVMLWILFGGGAAWDLDGGFSIPSCKGNSLQTLQYYLLLHTHHHQPQQQQYTTSSLNVQHPSSTSSSSSGHHMDRIVSPSSPRVNTNKPTFSTSSSASNLQQAFSSSNNNNNNNNINISFENVQEEIITVPLSQELIQVYQKQLFECIQKLKQTHTDGKDKAKSLEQIIYLACTLKSDFTMALFGEYNKSTNNQQQQNDKTTSSSSASSTMNGANNNSSTTTGQWTYSPQLDLFIKCMRYLLLHRSSYIRSLTGIVHFLSYIDGTLLQMEQQQPQLQQQQLNSRSTTATTTATAGQGANNGNTSTAVFSECERKSKSSTSTNASGTTGSGTTTSVPNGAGGTTTSGAGGGTAIGSSSSALNTSTSAILSTSAASSIVHGGFSNDVTFYADHSGDEDRVVNICFVFLSMTILTLIDSGLIDSLLYLSKQSMINNKKKQTKNLDPKDKLNINDDDDEDKSERAFISFRASQLLQSVLLFSDMLLNKRTCLNMQDRFDTEIANFLLSITKSNLYSYKTLSMLSAFYQQSFQSSNVTGGSIHVDQAMIQAPANLSVLSDSTPASSDSIGDRFSKFSTTNIPTFYIRTQIDSDMDDQSFNQLIKESNVLVTKDPKRWNWEKIYCLIFGPLRVAHRLKEVTTKSQKLLKRILSYFKPYKRAFSDLKYQESNFGYTKLCNELLYNLLHMDESGIEIIRECKIIKQFYEVLEIEVRVGKTTSVGGRNDPKPIDSEKRLLSEERVQKYMVRDYFTIIGLMSSTIKGKELLEEEKIFDVLKDLTTRRDDISQLIIKHLDYTRPFSDRAREILKEAMMNGSNIIRYISTLFIRHLIRQSQTYPNNFHAWGVPLLTSKLYDDWEKVKFSAISILSEVCCMNMSSNSSSAGDSSSTSDFEYDDSATSMLSSPRVSSGSNENLLAFVSQNISRDVMESVMREGRDGMNLLLKMTSCREGIDYLSHDSIRLLQELVEDWFERESYQYLQQVEYGLNRFYNMNQSAPSNTSYSPSSTTGHTTIGGSQLVVGSLSPSGFRETGMASPTFRSSNQAQFQSLSGSYDYAKHGVILQSNLYGELCHTLEGCTILTNDKHRTLHCLCMNLLNVYQSVLTYHNNIANRLSNSNDSNIEPQIEQIVELWSLAFCCSTNTGYEYCNRYIQQVIIGYEKNQNESFQTAGDEQFTVVQYFVYIALHSKDISLRGTTLYLLGILSKCSLARKDLFEIGFECSYRYAISIPRDRKSFFTIITDNSSSNESTGKNNTSSTSNHHHHRKDDFDEDDYLLTSILKESPKNADLIKDLVSNVTKIANPVHEQQSSTNLQNLKTNIARVLTNNEKSKLIYYFLGNHFTHCKYKWKIIKFVINDLLGGNSSMLCSSIATSNDSAFPSFDPNVEDELYVMNTHLLWLDTETDLKINKLQQQ